MLTHEGAACLEVALEANGLKHVHVRKSGLITCGEHGHSYVFCNPELGLSALPLAHHLHIAMTGEPDPVFPELFERALQRADIEEAERFFHSIGEVDIGQVQRLLPVVVDRYKYRLICYNTNIEVALRDRLELIGQCHAS
jgi:hypothetical protein